MTAVIYRTLLFLFLQVAYHLASGQEGIQNIKFGHLTTEHGLSKNQVQCIYQDRKGFMWFATRDGLDRYDGYNFTIFRNDPADPTSIGSSNIKGLCEDKAGNLWIATDGGGLNLFNRSKESFTLYMPDSQGKDDVLNSRLNSIAIDRKGNIVTGHDVGFNVFNPIKKTFSQHHFPSSVHKEVLMATTLPDSKGNVWLGTRAEGLKCFTAENKLIDFEHDSLGRNIARHSIRKLYEDRQGYIWIGTGGNGLYRFDPSNQKFLHFQHKDGDRNSLCNNSVLSLLEDNENNLWIGTQNGGLSILDAERKNFSHLQKDDNDPASLSNNSIYAIYIDNTGIMWIGTFSGGVNFYDKHINKFKHYRHSPSKNSVSNDIIKGICEDHRGNIWLTTEGGGINEFNPHTTQFRNFKHDPENKNSISTNYTLAIYEDTKQNILIGTWRGGLNILNKERNTFKTYKNNPNDSTTLGADEVSAIHESKDGTIWIGTSIVGLNSFDPVREKFRTYWNNRKKIHAPVIRHVNSIAEDSQNILWLGSHYGLFLFYKDIGHFEQVKYSPHNPTSLSNDLITLLYKDSKDRLWVGTENGLNLLQDRAAVSFKRYGMKDGLPNGYINGILEDEKGNLWVSSNAGLSCLNPQTNKIRNYDIHDGLQNNEFKRAACVKAKNGYMYFGGVDGFNVFHPDSIQDNTFIPPVYIRDFQIFNKSAGYEEKDSPLKNHISETKEITLSYKQSVFSFEFVALNYTLSAKNQYAYKLEGFDKNWNYVGTQRKATYTNLDPGEYVFKVKASNNDGIWNERGTSITITITPPFWQTWWFRVLAAAAIVSSMVTWYKIRIEVIKRQKAALELQVKERTEQLAHSMEEERKARQEAEHANRAKSTFLATMSHEIRTPMNGVMGMASLLAGTSQTGEQQEYTDTILSCGESLLSVINDILDYSKIESGKMELEHTDFDLRTCIEEVLDIFGSKAAHVGLELVYEIDYNVPSQIIGDSLRLRQILMNLVSNAIKFTAQGEIFIGVHLLSGSDDRIELGFSVRDTGIGIPADKLERLFKAFSQVDSSTTRKYGGTGLGLVICERLVELMGGRIVVESRVGVGTTFTFTIHTGISQQSVRTYVHYNTTSLEGKKVLIVDDNVTNRTILKNQLEAWKLIPILATSGSQALAILSQTSGFELVITDMQMPEMDGLQLAKSIRKQYPALPIILLSSVGDDRKLHSELFSSVLNKPVRQKLLYNHILTQLRQQDKIFTVEEPEVKKKLRDDFAQQYPLHILIAEDNPVNQKLAERVLTKLGYKPKIAVNGYEALKALELINYDLILMDVQMPEMDGFEATQKIRLQKKAQPVIVAVTANAMQGDREACLQAGMDDYISKPIKLDDVINIIEKWANKHNIGITP